MSAVLAFDNTYARELDHGFRVRWPPAPVLQPRLLFVNQALAADLGLAVQGPGALGDAAAAALFSGQALPEGADPVAQAYAGHQFGGFSPQLGDGRALLLGEVVDRHGQRRDIAFKGSGRTPFSRGGDGKAAVGPMLREALMGEALHALGIPTTRALAVVATGEPVHRDRPLPGAVLTRVAASHLRVGTFQYFAARRDQERLERLADYAIARHDPDLATDPDRVLAFFRAVAQRQATLVAAWMNVGFIHGVMNTDNMTISGETMDFGPCAFVEAHDPQAVFSSIDHGGRYAFGQQPAVARWNLARLAEALLPLIDADSERAVERATEVLDAFVGWYEAAFRRGLRAKLGLLQPGMAVAEPAAADPMAEEDDALAADWLDLLQAQRVDFTLAWRHLADVADVADVAEAADAARVARSADPAGSVPARLRALFAQPDALLPWLARWRGRLAWEHGPSGPERAAAMRRASPWIVPRNHLVEEALTAASDHADLLPFERLLRAVRQPFEERPAHARFAEPAPAAFTASYRTFCGT